MVSAISTQKQSFSHDEMRLYIRAHQSDLKDLIKANIGGFTPPGYSFNIVGTSYHYLTTRDLHLVIQHKNDFGQRNGICIKCSKKGEILEGDITEIALTESHNTRIQAAFESLQRLIEPSNPTWNSQRIVAIL